jgi:hypothetical protein
MPKVDRLGGGQLPERLSHSGAPMTGHGIGKGGGEIGCQAKIKRGSGLTRHRVVHDNGSDAMLGEKECGPLGLKKVGIAMTDIGDVMPRSQA